MGSERNDIIDGFSTITNTGTSAQASFIEKKSEFIGDACHIKTMDEALAFVQSVRDRNPKARHVAFAAIYGAALGAAKERMSDDGEPSGTAGKPILDVIRMGRLTDCVITVTRYFGGILLGSGGLIRAYSTAASMAVKAADVERIVPMRHYRVVLQYSWLGRFEQLLAQVGGNEEGREFTDRVTIHLAVPSANAGDFETRVREAFNAQARLLRL
ncbi:YigZ family protein [Bifidobacterium sp. ESL0800]|uniref:IMPACT family protein n=1 Tax=Bifidobacterium sp. ESL0800 TaxID=2983236 RepID=UPI0023F78F9A|nr:YigZ family protein [Bifidobacterium sp. ESL0800]WEV75711.1 IMPACT family protein [Bifidobacterium sp. ESL0800]